MKRSKKKGRRRSRREEDTRHILSPKLSLSSNTENINAYGRSERDCDSESVLHHLLRFGNTLLTEPEYSAERVPCALERICTHLFERYVVGDGRGLVTDEEVDAITRYYNLVQNHRSVSYRSRFRESHCARYRVVSVAFHLHPDVECEELSCELLEGMCGRLKKLVYEVYGRDGERLIGFSLRFDSVCLRDVGERSELHFHANVLPLYVTKKEYERLRANVVRFLDKVVSKWRYRRISVSTDEGEIVRMARVSQWAFEHLFDVRKGLKALSSGWLRVQSDVLGRRLRKPSEKLVSMRDAEPKEVFAGGSVDGAHQFRYHSQQHKFQTSAYLNWLEDENKVWMKARGRRGSPVILEPLDFLRRHLMRELRVRGRTCGLLHGRSAFRHVLDRVFAATDSPTSITYWATMTRERLLWALSLAGSEVLRHAVREYVLEWKLAQEKKFKSPKVPMWWLAGKYRDILLYLWWLAENPPKKRPPAPGRLTGRATLRDSLGMVEKDKAFQSWLERESVRLMLDGNSRLPNPVAVITVVGKEIPADVAAIWQQHVDGAVTRAELTTRAWADARGRPCRNWMRRALATFWLLLSGEAKDRKRLAERLGCAQSCLSERLKLAVLSREVIEFLARLEAIPARISESWLRREAFSELPAKEQMQALLRRGGSELRRTLPSRACVGIVAGCGRGHVLAPFVLTGHPPGNSVRSGLTPEGGR